jgi:tRNA pseudouridine32 synthase/23S rRNA pseudouridine746 synthase
MASLGVPITGDPLYPKVIDVASHDFSTPLQLLAQRIEFEDPLTGRRREFTSRRTLSGVPVTVRVTKATRIEDSGH